MGASATSLSLLQLWAETSTTVAQRAVRQSELRAEEEALVGASATSLSLLLLWAETWTTVAQRAALQSELRGEEERSREPLPVSCYSLRIALGGGGARGRLCRQSLAVTALG